MGEELDEVPPFYDSIEEYWDNWEEVADDSSIANCSEYGLPYCSTCLFGRHDTLS